MGTIRVDGLESAWLSGDLLLGTYGSGTVDITNGGTVEIGDGYLGIFSEGIGKVTVDGPGSTWTGKYLSLGGSGSETLLVKNGGAASNDVAFVGSQSGGVGVLTVDGDGSTWTSDRLYLGHAGAGTLNVKSGGIVSNPIAWLGYFSNAVGEATVDGANSLWTVNVLSLGFEGKGILNILNGGVVSSYRATVGSSPGASGEVSIAHGSELQVAKEIVVGDFYSQGKIVFDDGILTSGSLFASPSQLEGNGVINTHGLVSDLDLVFDASHGLQQQIILDDQPNQNVTINLDVDGSGSLGVGYNGHGTLRIAQGQVVSSDFGSLGRNPGSDGSAIIEGNGSFWAIQNGLGVGGEGDATLEIRNGGYVVSGGASVGGGFGTTSHILVRVDGPGSTWYIGGDLDVSTLGEANIEIVGGGSVEVHGQLRLGEFESGETTINLIDGSLTLHGGALSSGSDASQFNFSGGRFEGAGTIDLGHALVQNGGAFAPGYIVGTTIIEDDYTLNAGTLEIDLDGTGVAGFDLLQVNGAVDLVGSDGLFNGLLKVDLSYEPLLNEEFQILENDGTDSINGSFATENTVNAAYGSTVYRFSISYNAGDGNDVAIMFKAATPLGDYNRDYVVDAADYTVWRNSAGEITAAYFGADGDGDRLVGEGDYLIWKQHYGNTLPRVVVLGDYNFDGTVDAADYTVWRNSLGQSGVGLAADGNASGAIDAGDYDVWKMHFGETAGSGSGAGSAGYGTRSVPTTFAPEPASAMLLVFAAIAIMFLRERGKSCR